MSEHEATVSVVDPSSFVRHAPDYRCVAFRAPFEPRVAIVEGSHDSVSRFLVEQLGMTASEADEFIDELEDGSLVGTG